MRKNIIEIDKMFILSITIDSDGKIKVSQIGDFNEIKHAYVLLGEHVIRMLKNRKSCPFSPDFNKNAIESSECA